MTDINKVIEERKIIYYSPITHYVNKAIYCTDCIEFCPYKNSQDIFVVGTYEVLQPDEEPQIIEDNILDDNNDDTSKTNRTGRLMLQSISREEDKKIRVNPLANVNTPAIFDLKWSYNKVHGKSLLGMVDAVGKLTIYELQNKKTFEVVDSTKEGEGELCCSLDWANRIENVDRKIVVSRSNGYISLYNFENPEIIEREHWKGHDYEAWISAFDHWNTNIIYTGGDDSLFKGWDMRMDVGIPAFVNKRHEAGVCSIQVNPLNENIMATGSYDTYLNIWDKRNLTHPLIHHLTEGGVWKLKWHPKNPNYLAAACMYNGFHIYDINTNLGDKKIEEICTYDKHKSISYGIDWSQEEVSKNQLVGTCSFYDHMVHIWEMNPNQD